ncbi:MAG: hypothetical protein WC346_21510 [Methanogenium sp.]|jgi:hypothetical protein
MQGNEGSREAIGKTVLTMAENADKELLDLCSLASDKLLKVASFISPPIPTDTEKTEAEWPSYFSDLRSSILAIKRHTNELRRLIEHVEL